MRFISLCGALLALLALLSGGAWSCAGGATELDVDGGIGAFEGGAADAAAGGHEDGARPDGGDSHGGDAREDVVSSKFAVGGTITGLSAADSVVLQDNLSDDLTVTTNGSFTFTTSLAAGAVYSVTVLTQPASPVEVCTVTGGGGTVGTADVTSVTIACAIPTFTVGGMVTGLESGDSVVLQDNLADNLTVSTNGSFTFATSLASGATYSVTVLTQPDSPAETCTVASGSGTVASADVSGVVVTCTVPSPTDVSFPTTTSTCAGPDSPGALGSGGGGVRYQTGDSVSQTYAGATSSTELILDFTMSDETAGCSAGVTLDWNVELNGTVVGTYSWVSASASSHTVSETYTYAAIAPISGEFTIELIATSTVCVGGGSWNWNPGGTATIE
jgi:hypothetical protein